MSGKRGEGSSYNLVCSGQYFLHKEKNPSVSHDAESSGQVPAGRAASGAWWWPGHWSGHQGPVWSDCFGSPGEPTGSPREPWIMKRNRKGLMQLVDLKIHQEDMDHVWKCSTCKEASWTDGVLVGVAGRGVMALWDWDWACIWARVWWWIIRSCPLSLRTSTMPAISPRQLKGERWIKCIEECLAVATSTSVNMVACRLKTKQTLWFLRMENPKNW